VPADHQDGTSRCRKNTVVEPGGRLAGCPARGFPGAVSRLLAYRAVAYAADNLIGDGDQVCEFRFAPLR
jgi:hypothetical protein